MLRRVLVGDNERVLLIRKKRLAEILGPGEYWIFTLGRFVEIERYNVKELAFAGEWTNAIVKVRPDLAAQYFTLVETGDAQIAVVYFDGKASRVVAPASRALFWKGALNVTFDLIDPRETPEVPKTLISPLVRLGREALAIFAVIEQGKRGLVYLDGRLIRELDAGRFGFWSVVKRSHHRDRRDAPSDDRSDRPGDPHQG